MVNNTNNISQAARGKAGGHPEGVGASDYPPLPPKWKSSVFGCGIQRNGHTGCGSQNYQRTQQQAGTTGHPAGHSQES